VPDVASANLVARTRERSPDDGDGCPEGLLRARGRVHELRRDGVTVTHDWDDGAFGAEGRLIGTDSSVVPVDRGAGSVPVYGQDEG